MDLYRDHEYHTPIAWALLPYGIVVERSSILSIEASLLIDIEISLVFQQLTTNTSIDHSILGLFY